MVLAAAAPPSAATTATAPKNAAPLARHLRPASAFALPLPFNTTTN
jgi:hypothetical protein